MIASRVVVALEEGDIVGAAANSRNSRRKRTKRRNAGGGFVATNSVSVDVMVC
jgi:hypothetical protein